MVPSGVGVYNATTEPGEIAALRDYLDGEHYLTAIRAAFSADDYFNRSRKAAAIAALEEMHAAGFINGLNGRDDLDRMKKGELATWAAEQAQRWGWLPPQLRHPAYELIRPEPKPMTGKMAAAEQSSASVDAPAKLARKNVRA